MARWCNLLHRYSGQAAHHRLAERAMRYLSSPAVAVSFNVLTARVLLADLEFTSEPVHITVCGRKDDPQARALFQAGLRYPAACKRVEWYDAREGPLPNQDVAYPTFEKAAAFVCTSSVCSAPIQDPEGVRPTVDRLASKGLPGGGREQQSSSR
jgi:uncharacterized protein YyaL (SSP411 family)